MDYKKSIGLEIRILSNLCRREMDRSSSIQYVESVTGTNGWIIGYLADNQGRDIFQRDLEEEFSVRRSTASKVLKLMEQKGLIRRESVPYDARLKKLVLPDTALEMHSHVVRDSERLEAKLTKGLTDEELQTFFAIAEKIKDNLQ